MEVVPPALAAALRELGVDTPVSRSRRVAMSWVASRVLSGERDLAWLVRVLWPSSEEGAEDGLLDDVVHRLDDTVEFAARVAADAQRPLTSGDSTGRTGSSGSSRPSTRPSGSSGRWRAVTSSPRLPSSASRVV